MTNLWLFALALLKLGMLCGFIPSIIFVCAAEACSERRSVNDEAPEGYRWEWRPDEGWSVGGEGRKCRMLRCPNQAVAALRRHRKPTKAAPHLPNFQWWHYCADHLYGRKIEDGVVKARILVKENEIEVPL